MDKTKAPSITPINGDARRFISAGRRLLAVIGVSPDVQTRIWKKPKGCMSAPGFMVPSAHLDVKGHCISFFNLSKCGRPARTARWEAFYFLPMIWLDGAALMLFGFEPLLTVGGKKIELREERLEHEQEAWLSKSQAMAQGLATRRAGTSKVHCRVFRPCLRRSESAVAQ